MASPMMMLSGKTIDILRDTALAIENDDTLVARELMALASAARPSGEFIASKLAQYNTILNSHSQRRAKDFFRKLCLEQVVIIPAGFRCYTKQKLSTNFGIRQASLPFDYGFFPPESIIKTISEGVVHFDYANKNSFAVCTKNEQHICIDKSMAIKFSTSSFEEIDRLYSDARPEDKNSLLDSTGSYYILDQRSRFVLAHYIWHSSSVSHNLNGIQTIAQNMEYARLTINRRLVRLLRMCNKAEKIIFVVDIPDKTSKMIIDDDVVDLRDLTSLRNYVKSEFGSRARVFDIFETTNKHDFFERMIE